MGKRLLTALLILCLGCGLCACGNDTQTALNSEPASAPATFSGSSIETTVAPDVSDTPSVDTNFVPWVVAGLTDHVMDWRDEALAAKMAEVTGITGDIMLSDVWELTGLDLTGDPTSNGITDISALGELTNLTRLDLTGNGIIDTSNGIGNVSVSGGISDISALSRLTNLTELRLDTNSISDISALSGLTNLFDLCLRLNKITDISALGGMTKLFTLDLSHNSISDISVLSRMTNLTYLYLSGNEITDISALGGLTRLVHLSLDYNGISDISVLSRMTNLTQLFLNDNDISNVSALSGLTNLAFLSLSNNRISDYSPVEFVEHLSPLEDTVEPDDEYSGICGNDVRWSYDPDTKTLTISGHGNMHHYSPYRGIGIPYDQYREDIMTVVIQDGVTGIGDNAFFWFTNLTNMARGTSVTIPDSVTSIGDAAFYFCERLSNVAILGNITSIGNDTFVGCGCLTSITIPKSVTSIGNRAFADCASLTDIYYTGTQEQWAAISTGLPDNESLTSATIHYNCMADSNFTIENGALVKYNGSGGDVIIPSSVTSIGDEAFAFCAGVTSVTIPDNVTSIGMSAFLWCIELKDVYYTGTEAQWESINIDETAFTPDPTAVTIHYNS